MHLENQVCNLEISKKLKKLGVNKNSLFVWVKEEEGTYPNFGIYINPRGVPFEVEWYPAYTAEEIGDILPQILYIDSVDDGIIECFLQITKLDELITLNRWDVCYYYFYGAGSFFSESDWTLSNAIGKILISLLENDVINQSNELKELKKLKTRYIKINLSKIKNES